MRMRETFLAGALAVALVPAAGCHDDDTIAGKQAMCEKQIPRHESPKNPKSQCKDAQGDVATFCENLVQEMREKALSACMTGRTGKKTTCTIDVPTGDSTCISQ